MKQGIWLSSYSLGQCWPCLYCHQNLRVIYVWLNRLKFLFLFGPIPNFIWQLQEAIWIQLLSFCNYSRLHNFFSIDENFSCLVSITLKNTKKYFPLILGVLQFLIYTLRISKQIKNTCLSILDIKKRTNSACALHEYTFSSLNSLSRLPQPWYSKPKNPKKHRLHNIWYYWFKPESRLE